MPKFLVLTAQCFVEINYCACARLKLYPVTLSFLDIKEATLVTEDKLLPSLDVYVPPRSN